MIAARAGAAVRLRDVSVRLGGVEVLHGLDLGVDAGEWLTLVGPNGAGKSTVLRAIAGVVAHGGSIAVDGQELTGRPDRRRARLVALVPQRPVLPPGATVVDYVLLGRTPYLPPLRAPGAADRSLVSRVLAELELTDFAERELETMSGGELQRVFLARALAQQPALLLLDEPTAALDVGHAQDVLGLVDRLRADVGLTVISTMHDLTLAGGYADRLAMLDRGRMVAIGAPAEVLTAELVGRVYRADVVVTKVAKQGTNGAAPVVVPIRR